MEKKIRSSNLELLRILCILSIVSGHFIEQSGLTYLENKNLNKMNNPLATPTALASASK